MAPDAAVKDESRELLLDIPWQAYHTELTAQDAFIASVVEFALVLRQSDYQGVGTMQSVLNRLNDLDLSQDAYKTEFRELVKACMDRNRK